jgi:hypothetical protein
VAIIEISSTAIPSATVVVGPYAPLGPGLTGTSTSTVEIGLGPKSFITQFGLGFQAGVRIRATVTDTPTIWLEGVVTSYEGSTLIVNSDLWAGSTLAFNTWVINVTGEPGKNGDAGAQGPQGIPGGVLIVGSPVAGQLAQWAAPPTGLTGIDISSFGFATLGSPNFTGDPKAPTPPIGDNDTSIATTQFVKSQNYLTLATATASLQPIDGDLTSIAAAAGTNTLYYRSAADTWSPVTIGANISFAGGTLSATLAGGGGGNVFNSGTPGAGQLARWVSSTAIEGVDFATLGYAPIGSPAFTGTPTAPTPATSDNSTRLATTAYVKAQSQPFGKMCVPVPASAMIAQVTNGAVLTILEMTTNDNMFVTMDFSPTTQQYVQFSMPMPDSWNESTVTFVPIWSHPSTTTNFGVVWELAALARSDNEAGDIAFGTGGTSTDTGGTTNNIYLGPESAAITVGQTPVTGDFVMFRISRLVANASDTLAVNARLHGIKLFITTDAGHD